jgi:hypothetical protein
MSLEKYFKSENGAEKLWSIVLPVITTLIGYIFGFNNKGNDKADEE